MSNLTSRISRACLIAVSALFFSLTAQAQPQNAAPDLEDRTPVSDTELKGLIEEVNEDERTITVRTEEVGESIDVEPGSLRSYRIDDETEIESRSSFDPFGNFNDLEEGNIVVLEFEEEATGSFRATRVGSERREQP